MGPSRRCLRIRNHSHVLNNNTFSVPLPNTQAALRVTIKTAAAATTPPSNLEEPKDYVINVYKGTSTTPDQSRTVAAANAGTVQTFTGLVRGVGYRAAVVPVGMNGSGPESQRSSAVTIAQNKTGKAGGRKLAEETTHDRRTPPRGHNNRNKHRHLL